MKKLFKYFLTCCFLFTTGGAICQSLTFTALSGTASTYLAKNTNTYVLFGFSLTVSGLTGSGNYVNVGDIFINTGISNLNDYLTGGKIIQTTNPSSITSGTSGVGNINTNGAQYKLNGIFSNNKITANGTYTFYLVFNVTNLQNGYPSSNLVFSLPASPIDNNTFFFVNNAKPTFTTQSVSSTTTSNNSYSFVNAIYDWYGNSSPADYSWSNYRNWYISGVASTVVPGANDVARFGVIAFVHPPNALSASANIGSIVFGNLSGQITLTVNNPATLTVTGDIVDLNDNYSYNNYSHTLAGSGIIVANNIAVTSNSVDPAHPISYKGIISSSVTSLKVANIKLTSNVTMYNTTAFTNDATFNVTGGVTNISGNIQTTNVAGSTSTITISNGKLQLAGATALSGLSTFGTNTLTFNGAGATIEYSGTSSQQTVYTDATIPGLTTGPSYQNIAFSGSGIKTPNSGNLNIAGNFTNSLTNNTINYVSLLTTPVIFNGPGAQSLDGGAGTGTTFKNVTFSGGGNATITANTGNFSVSSNGVLTMSNNSQLTAGTTVVGGAGYLTLKSDANSSAAVAAITGTSAIAGNVNVERYLQGGSTKDGTRWAYRNYRLMSSPVNTIISNTGATTTYPFTFQYIANGAIVTGAKGGYAPSNTFNSSSAVGNPTIYLYREDKTPSNASFTAGNFTGVTDITGASNTGLSDGSSTKISVGNGFMFFFRGDRINAVGTTGANKTTTPYVAVEPVTFTATGFLNQGAYTVQNWTGGGVSLKFENNPTYLGVNQDNSMVRGYNLVGNPYASSINWDLFATSGTSGIVGVNVDPTIYVFNPLTNQYNTYMKGDGGVGKGYGGSTTAGANTVNANIIPSGQGFFVRANNHSSTLTFYESAKAPTSQVAASNLLMSTSVPVTTSAAPQYMRLVLNKDSINNDDNLIFFRSTADTKYDASEDAKYFSGNSPAESLSSMSSDNVKLAINRMPLPKQKETRVVNLNVTAATNGLYTFKRSDLKGIPDIYDIWLMDSYKKDSLDIKHNSTYAFNIDKADTNSFGSKRFQIVIRQNPSLALKLLGFSGNKITTGTLLQWITENENSYTNFTIEKSTDNGKTFEVVGGFRSNNSGTYALVDKFPAKGANQYRLKQDDLDGTITYSKIVTVMYANTQNDITASISIFPNPVSSTLSVSLNNFAEIKASYSIKITNSSGIIVKSQTASQPSWQDNVSNLLPGTYFVQVTNNDTKKIIGNGKFIKE